MRRRLLVNRRRAFSLIEILVVIAIIAIIAALLFPALIGAKKQARGTDDLSKMKQLGLAANLYHEQTGAWPRGVSDIVGLGLAPKELCSLSNDPLPGGIGNEVAAHTGNVPGISQVNLVLPYRNSLIGLREDRVNEETVSQFIENGTAGGWLLDFSKSERSKLNESDVWFISSKGTYRRLCFDTAVVTRPFKNLVFPGEVNPPPRRMPIMFFVDPSEEMLQWAKSLQ